jgi:hypothetical protein
MFEILKETPGYTKGKGMFYKNLDDAGTFDDKGSEPAGPEKKQRQFATRKLKGGDGINARKQAREDAASGESNFAGFVAKYRFQDAEEQDLKTLEKIYNKEFAEKTSQLSESYFGEFHEREKRLMIEEQVLMESGGREGGSQWSISATQMEAMDETANVEYYGTLNLSTKNIKACADIYIKKMGEDVMALLETTKDFTENIGKYFSADRRSTAMNANQKAQEDGMVVVNLLAQDPVTDDTEV